MDEIHRGERQPSREFVVDSLQVKEIRKATGLTQAKFAAMIDVQLGTLRNWEQGRREPTGPARRCCAPSITIRSTSSVRFLPFDHSLYGWTFRHFFDTTKSQNEKAL